MKTRWGMALLLLFMIAAIIIYRQVHDRSKEENLYTDGQLRMEIQTVQSLPADSAVRSRMGKVESPNTSMIKRPSRPDPDAAAFMCIA